MLTVGVGSYGIACVACLGLIALLSARWISRHWTIIGLVVITLVWAALGLGAAWGIGDIDPAYGVADFLRSAALLLLLNHALQRLSDQGEAGHPERFGGILASIAGVLALGLGAYQWSEAPNAALWALIGHIGLAVAGLFLIENLLQASRPDALWSTKHLLIGAGAIFAFDLFYYTDALLLLRVDDTLRAAQPVIATLAFPLILISAHRLRDVAIRLPVSRGLVVGTTALLASGIYILSVAAFAYLIRVLGWAWGPTLQLIFLFGAAMVLLVLLSSTSFRHGGRRFIERNLFTFAYDYRREWLRLVESMASGPVDAGQDDLTLAQRALKATATLMDADGGALFMKTALGDLQFTTSWNIALENQTPGAPPQQLLAALSAARPVLVLDGHEHLPDDLAGQPALSVWLGAFKAPWIALALIARNEVVGLALVTRPRMQRRLTFEDLDILQIFAHQLGSYLAVEELARHLAEAEHFERMSKHVTFVAHDLKNVISQLSLVLQQAKDHAHNPAFVSDTFLTIGDAVERMKRLMQRVQEGADQAPLQPVDLSVLARDVEMRGRVQALTAFDEGVTALADPLTLLALLDHVIDNAWEACEQAGAAATGEAEGHPLVSLALKKDGGFALLEIADRGVGMTSAFIETELFKPFASTKASGFGIGMYQCRDWIERWRGRLDVESEPGRGTTIRMRLPLAGGERIDACDARAEKPLDPAEERAA
ncbi:MAG: PEP-CTERM system histidine kinase PrsK [Alphaproteobacteria bacterium]|nr:PEP-CTERM system histidine kinase PrsK [Alphaproteobacteria bacterium]